MNLELFISTVIAVGILAAITVAANYADKRQSSGLRNGLIAVLALFNLLMVLYYGIIPLATEEDGVSSSEAAEALVLALAFGAASTAVLFPKVRFALAHVFPSRRKPVEAKQPPASPGGTGTSGQPLFPQMLNYYTTETAASEPLFESTPAPEARQSYLRGFDPASSVHLVAMVFALYLLGTQFATFALGGGLEGVAENFASGLTGWDLLLNALPLVVIPLIGVGFGIRRGWRATFDRLGLHQLTLRGLGAAVGMTIALLILVAIVGSTWQYLVPPETFEEQTRASEALSESVTTIGLALLLAATAAISEEIAFRGALQPVFGFWPTAILFSLTHIQYTLTPASLIILGVAVAFGWLRMRYSTTVSMVTHFLYNFIPLALNVSIAGEGALWLIHLLS